ncbi:MAG: gamma-glutamylcyclotransferase [Proteobacteria bacterium]|nr:gamma-glutamylcyclotransferase [Pseudomonadota bacterium]
MTWIFGYGSLVWRPSVPFESALAGEVRGWQRRFWQGSTDHRGVPGAPGRVVTVLPDASATTGGRVFALTGDVDAVLARLDHREKGGYQRVDVVVHTSRGPIDALMYAATEANQNYLGPAPLADVAAQVVASHGPSGPNLEYVLELDKALEQLGFVDDHVRALAALCRQRA